MSRPRSDIIAFTLLELLAAFAVLSVVLLLLVKMVQGAGDSADHYSRRLDAKGGAQIALERLEQDLGLRVRGNGATLLFRPGRETESDVLRFLTFARPDPMETTTRMSLVEYRIAFQQSVPGEDAFPQLLRGDTAILWPAANDDDATCYDYPALLSQTTENHFTVAEGVARFEILWLGRDGELIRIPPGAIALANGFYSVNASDVSAFTVTTASLDRKSRALIQQGDWAPLQTALPEASSTAPVSESLRTWNNALGGLSPAMARRNIRFTEKVILLP